MSMGLLRGAHSQSRGDAPVGQGACAAPQPCPHSLSMLEHCLEHEEGSRAPCAPSCPPHSFHFHVFTCLVPLAMKDLGQGGILTSFPNLQLDAATSSRNLWGCGCCPLFGEPDSRECCWSNAGEQLSPCPARIMVHGQHTHLVCSWMKAPLFPGNLLCGSQASAAHAASAMRPSGLS